MERIEIEGVEEKRCFEKIKVIWGSGSDGAEL
jgi:hypothetical protein